MSCYIICREDTDRETGEKGKYVLVNREFTDWEAACKYYWTVDKGREPKILMDEDETRKVYVG